MNPIYLILIGAVSLGFAEAINGTLLKKYKEVTSVGLILIGALVSFILSGLWMLIFRPPTVPLDIRMIGLIIAVGILAYFANKNFYNSFKYQDASTSTIILMSTIIVTTLFGRIVFGESIHIVQWLGILLVMVAVLLINMGEVSIDRFKQVFKPNVATRLVLFSAFLYGITNGISKLIVLDINPHYYQFLDIVLVTPLFILLDWKEVVGQLKVISRPNILFTFAPVILFYFTYNILKYIALSRGLELPIGDAVDNLVVFVIIALEILIFKVKGINLGYRLGVSVIAVLGVYLIQAYS